MRVYPNFSFSYLSLLADLSLIALFYFAFVSYGLIDGGSAWKTIKKSLRIGSKKFVKLVPMLIMLFLAFFIINRFIGVVAINNPALLIPLGILLVFPAFAWGRVVFMMTTKSLVERSHHDK